MPQNRVDALGIGLAAMVGAALAAIVLLKEPTPSGSTTAKTPAHPVHLLKSPAQPQNPTQNVETAGRAAAASDPPVAPGIFRSPEPANVSPVDPAEEDDMHYIQDPSIPAAVRLAKLESLGRDPGPRAAATLMALGDMETYFNYAAVESLGQTTNTKVRAYLRAKLQHADARVVCAAVRALARASGADAVQPISDALHANRSRADGYQDDVCGACVDALGAIGSVEAVPVLAAEFHSTYGMTLRHEYGSRLVQALVQIGSPLAIPAIEGYVERLKIESEGLSDNPMGRAYIEDKITEARNTIVALKGGP